VALHRSCDKAGDAPGSCPRIDTSAIAVSRCASAGEGGGCNTVKGKPCKDVVWPGFTCGPTPAGPHHPSEKTSCHRQNKYYYQCTAHPFPGRCTDRQTGSLTDKYVEGFRV
jgi:hypothetical protein